jgi:1-phosphatidylinositol-3-phosphate 5-kinase
MDAPDKTFSELVGIVKSWIPRRSEPANVSRDFWMPDQSCRVCYECDSQFTIFNRRHHCRLCGRVFCARCTENSIPAPSGDLRTAGEEWEKIRVCNYCFKQWQQGMDTLGNGIQAANQDLSTSPSATSLASTKSSGTANSNSITLGSMQYSVDPYQQVLCSSGLSPRQSSLMEASADRQGELASGRSEELVSDVGNPNQYGFSMTRFDRLSCYYFFLFTLGQCTCVKPFLTHSHFRSSFFLSFQFVFCFFFFLNYYFLSIYA